MFKALIPEVAVCRVSDYEYILIDTLDHFLSIFILFLIRISASTSHICPPPLVEHCIPVSSGEDSVLNRRMNQFLQCAVETDC